MSFLHNFAEHHDPVAKFIGTHGAPLEKAVYKNSAPSTPPPTPPVPNPNDAANASQQLTDQMRQRRGMLANIYAGSLNQAPVTGKTQLGS